MIMQISNKWTQLAEKVVKGHQMTADEALSILHSSNEELLALLKGSFMIRNNYFGRKVKLNMIMNAKSGLCPEDCGYCSQSIVSEAPIDKYAWLTKEKILDGAQESIRRKAGTYCIVASGRRPTDREIEHVAEAVREIRETTDLKICCCLGFLKENQAQKLAEAGVHRYNHKLEYVKR